MGASAIVLSSENFEYLSEDQIHQLVTAIGCSNVRVILFYRNWTPLLFSIWQEDIKHGGSATYHEYCLPHLVAPESSNLLNYELIISKFSKIVGLDNISISSYDSIVSSGKDVYQCFLDQIGVRGSLAKPPNSDDNKQVVNPSLDSPTIEIIRAINSIATSEGYARTYLYRYYYTTSWLQGDGAERHSRLIRAMTPHLVPLEDYSHCEAAKRFFARFLRRYAPQMVDDSSCRAEYVNKALTIPVSIVRQDYLLAHGIYEDLRAGWSHVRKYLESHPEILPVSRHSL
jgi:hypothetical protein